jgi:hypothetical protein
MLRQAVCPECGKHGYDDSEACDWCDERTEFIATELLRNFAAEEALKLKAST